MGGAGSFRPLRVEQPSAVFCSARGFFVPFLFRLHTVVVVGSLYWARSRRQPSIFSLLFRLTSKALPQNIVKKRDRKKQCHVFRCFLFCRAISTFSQRS